MESAVRIEERWSTAESAQQRLTVTGFSDTAQAALSHLRMTSLDCRARARTDIFHACALLATTPTATHAAFSEALMRCLQQALGRAPVIFRPGEGEISFDEAWLMRTIEAAQNDDHDSFSFLIRSRVDAAHRRLATYLIASVARYSKTN